MSKRYFAPMLLATACFLLSACGEPAANNAANKPANAANNAATAPVNTTAIEADLKKMTNDMAASTVKSDVAALEKIWADNYMFISPDGTLSTRAQRIESMKSGDTKLDSLSYDEVTVRVNPEGTGAIVVARATAKGKNLGQPVDGQSRVTHVWSKTKDGWRMVSGQVTRITSPAPAKADDTKAAETNKAATTNSANKY